MWKEIQRNPRTKMGVLTRATRWQIWGFDFKFSLFDFDQVRALLELQIVTPKGIILIYYQFSLFRQRHIAQRFPALPLQQRTKSKRAEYGTGTEKWKRDLKEPKHEP